MDFTIPAGAITNLGTAASGIGTGTITNIGALASTLGIIVVVLFSRGLIMRGLAKLGM